jgi:PAS domain S-box-containing protein
MIPLADFLEAQAGALVQRWTERLRAEGPGALSTPELHEQVPAFLAQAVRAIRTGRVESTPDGPRRQRPGFDLDAVIREYAALRNVILDLAGAEGLDLASGERRLLIDTFLSAISDAAAEFTRQQQHLEASVREARAAHEASRRLHSLFAQAPVGFAIFMGPRYVIEQANPAVCRIWGRTPAQVLGKPLFEALPEAAGQGFEQLLDGVLSTGVPYIGKELPARIARLAGGRIEEVYFNFVYEPLLSATGEVEGVIVVATDATDEVRERNAQAARARESEQRLAFALEAAGLGQWRYDLATGILEVSDAFKLNLGLDLSDEVPTLAHLLALIPIDDRPGVTAAIDQALRERGQFASEHRVLAPRGGTRWALSRGRVIVDAQGIAVAMTGIALDTTERKLAELEHEQLLGEIVVARNRLEQLFEHAPAFVCTLRGPEHVFEFVNSQYQQLVGLGRPLVGLRLTDALPEVAGQGFVEMLDTVYRNGEPFVGREVPVHLEPVPGRTSKDAWISFVYQATRDRHGAIDGMDVFGFEVTEHVLARRKAEALTQELRLRGEFEQYLIGIVSHDLRNPISTVLLGVSALLRDDALTDRQTKNVVRIRNSAERAIRMIRDLLDFTQARLGGGLGIERRPADLRRVLPAIIEELEATFAGREVRASFTGEAQGAWDPERLGQMLQNLLLNALKYSPEGTAVQVETRAEEGAVSIAVSNEGPPIPADRLTDIFEPMRRATDRIDRHDRSIGLGLYIVKQIVDAHVGTIAVRSTAGQGTTFTVRLPLAGP